MLNLNKTAKMDTNKLKSVLESLLFVSGEPVKISKLAKICGVSENKVETAVEDLCKDYEEGKRGLIVIKEKNFIQLASSPSNVSFTSQLVKSEFSADPSQAALEVLSVIAYRGPVSRVQIETIRGVNCSYILRSLLLKGLVERKESKKERGYLYSVSFDFLKSLGLKSVEELPDWRELSRSDKIDKLLSGNEQRPMSNEYR